MTPMEEYRKLNKQLANNEITFKQFSKKIEQMLNKNVHMGIG